MDDAAQTPVPLGPALVARPRALSWTPNGKSWTAHCAIGTFSVDPVPERVGMIATKDLWLPTLNCAPFPIIAATCDDAKGLASLGQIAHADAVLALDWRYEHNTWIANGQDLKTGKQTLWTVQPSHGTSGWVAMRDFAPAFVPMADEEQAMSACAQYAAYVWVALSDILGPAPRG